MEGFIAVGLKAVIVCNQKVLIVKRAGDDEIGAGTWEFAGGKLEFGEDLQQALKREVKEEAGLDIVVERLLYAASFKSNPQRQTVILTYLCRTSSNKVTLSSEHEEHIWATGAQLLDLLPASILKDLEENCILKALDIV